MSATRASEASVNVLLPGGAEPLSAPPRLVQAKHLTFGAGGRSVLRDELLSGVVLGYLADMLRPHGVPFDEARFTAGNQNSFGFLGGQCVNALRGTPEPDLIVLAHSTADCEPNRSVSGYLSTFFRGEPLCFAVSDQGELSPFTALRLMRGFGVLGTSRRSLVLILDQSTLPYARGPAPDRGCGETDHVLGLEFVSGPGPAGRPLAAVWQRSDVTPDRLGQALAEVTDELSVADPRLGQVTVVTDGQVRATDLPPWLRESGTRRRDSRQLGQPPPVPACVAPWATLAGLLPATADRGSTDDRGARGARGARVLVIGYDRSLTGLGVALFGPLTPGSVAGDEPFEAAA